MNKGACGHRCKGRKQAYMLRGGRLVSVRLCPSCFEQCLHLFVGPPLTLSRAVEGFTTEPKSSKKRRRKTLPDILSDPRQEQLYAPSVTAPIDAHAPILTMSGGCGHRPDGWCDECRASLGGSGGDEPPEGPSR